MDRFTRIITSYICLGAAIIMLALFGGTDSTRDVKNLETKLDVMNSKISRLEQSYSAFTNQYAQAHQAYSTNSPAMPSTNSIPQRAERTIRSADYADQLNRTQTH